MEAVGLFALAGLGYLVTRLSGVKDTEGFESAAQRGPDGDPLTKAPRGAGPQAPPQELDLMFQTAMGGPALPSEPTPGVQGTLLNYSPPAVRTVSMDPSLQPKPEPIESATPTVAMNPAGIQAQPAYIEGFVTSELTGDRVHSRDFTHNNMVPFFGGRVRQNVAAQTNTGILDTFTGSGVTQIKKKEIEPMFDTARAPYGNPFGMEDQTDFVQSRINDPRSRAGERPFEPVRVAPGVNEGFAATGKGGFQQFEVNQYMIDNIRRTDDLRTSDNPKETYNQPVVPGQHFIGMAAQESGEVRKYRPDTFYIDETGKRFFVTNGEVIKETTRPIQVLKHTARPETNSDAVGPATAQEFGESYVTGSYRAPMVQQYGGAGYRNADMTSYTSSDTDAPEADYGRSGYEVRPNERNVTSERTMGLNMVPAEAGALTVHYDDPNRPTRRQETVGNIRQTGTPVGYAQGAPAITVWDPNDIARTTVREGTINWNWLGQAAPAADGATRLKVYDPEDIARPTQKSQLTNKSEYYGPSNSVNKDFTSHDAAYNMRLNPNKQEIALGRDPMHGNGGALAVFDGNIHQTAKQIDADIINDRANAVNRVVGMPTGVGDIGQVRPRVPLKLDVSKQRNTPEMVSAVNANPLMASQNLAYNAEHDEKLLQEILATM
ncbi:MAG: hypothetical protein EBU66_07015 [Bacteroidetes bacterium]|nr:hypothetical protein [bacterium]NBP64412.1 hypothetical protein [Bacteroidota bacterium]